MEESKGQAYNYGEDKLEGKRGVRRREESRCIFC